jgi:hypothetical protein
MDYRLSEKTNVNSNQLPAPMLAAIREQEAQQRLLYDTVASLVARVAVLEHSLAKLQTCTVQQFPDGRLYLPAGEKLRIRNPSGFMNAYTTVDCSAVSADAPRPAWTGPPRPCGQVLAAPNPQLHAPSLPSGNGAGIGSRAGRDWQSIASANSIENPMIRNTSSGWP